MNKYQKSYEIIDVAIHLMCGEEREDGYKPTMNEVIEAMKVFKELVDRATPKPFKYFDDEPCCSTCLCTLFGENPAYFCPDCGQAIEWNVNR